MDEQSQNSSESIIIANCLSCQGLVRVPAKAHAQSRVRCPHCSESFQLAEILDRAVPELELVEEPQIAVDIPRVDKVLIKTENERDDRQKFVVPPQLSKGARRTRRRSSSRNAGGPVESSENSRNLTVTDDSPRRSSRSSRSRSKSRSFGKSSLRRGEPNSIIEMLKVVIGGLLAIPIAYLLVFWIFKQDPLDVGPKLGNVAPFLVPSEFRDNTNDDAENESEKRIGNDGSQKSDEEDPTDRDPTNLPIPDVDPDRIKRDGPD